MWSIHQFISICYSNWLIYVTYTGPSALVQFSRAFKVRNYTRKPLLNRVTFRQTCQRKDSNFRTTRLSVDAQNCREREREEERPQGSVKLCQDNYARLTRLEFALGKWTKAARPVTKQAACKRQDGDKITRVAGDFVMSFSPVSLSYISFHLPWKVQRCAGNWWSGFSSAPYGNLFIEANRAFPFCRTCFRIEKGALSFARANILLKYTLCSRTDKLWHFTTVKVIKRGSLWGC